MRRIRCSGSPTMARCSRLTSEYRDRPGAQAGAMLHAGRKARSNCMAEAFEKTFKRDYVPVSLIPNAAAALGLIDSWMEDYKTFTRIPGWATDHPASTP